jgi:Holliday junction resolvase RusA-like endonuclease
MTLIVIGTPISKGSARAFAIPGKDGARPRAVVVSDNKKPLTQWTTQIANEARLYLSVDHGPQPAFDGPFTVGATFYFNRPKSASVKSRPVPTVKPDLDKLTRAVLDALTGIVWRDDSQVVSIIARKFYLVTAEAEYAEIRINAFDGGQP